MKFLIVCLVFVIGAALGGILGGVSQLTDADQLKNLLDKIKNHLVTMSDKPNHSQLEYIGHSSVTYQVVAGTLYKMNGTLKMNGQEVDCLLTLWEKPWLNFEKFTAKCGEKPEQSYESVVGEERRHKRAVLIGGPQEVPEEEWPEIHTKMLGAFDQFHAQHENFCYNYKNIIGATKQVVNGVIYVVRVNVDVGESKDNKKECKVSVLEKSWKHSQMFTFECEEVKYEYTSSPATSASQ